MVREKDEAKKRVQARKDYLARLRADLEKKTIRFAWAVNEHTPEYDYGDGWSRSIPERNRVVSDWFNTEEEAKAWMDRHEPDEGNSLNIVRRRLIKVEYTEWVNY